MTINTCQSISVLFCIPRNLRISKLNYLLMCQFINNSFYISPKTTITKFDILMKQQQNKFTTKTLSSEFIGIRLVF